MPDKLIDNIRSVSALIETETAMLQSSGRHSELDEIVAAKVRLVAAIEADTSRLARERPQWKEELDPERRDALASATARLKEVAGPNAAILKRQIEFSAEMMAAIAAEARRLTGTRSETYRASGAVVRADLSTPISINAEF